MNFLNRKQFSTGAVKDTLDLRDHKYDEIALGASPIDWEKGFDTEKEVGITMTFKNQGVSSSCVGNGWGYYVGVLDALENKGSYKDVSAKPIYSQIHLPGGGASIRDGGMLIVRWGAVMETIITSYENGNAPSEKFMEDLSWKTPYIDKIAGILQAKECRVINGVNMEIVAQAIRDNYGVVGGLYVGHSGTWRTAEPRPSTREDGHCVYFAKFGIDKLGKFIATPNSWGTLGIKDSLHPDGWQKLREDYFNDTFSFNPWTLVDQPNQDVNIDTTDPEVIKLLEKGEKKIIVEGEGVGRKGIIINGKLREINKDRVGEANLYTAVNNGFGFTISTNLFNKLPKADNF